VENIAEQKIEEKRKVEASIMTYIKFHEKLHKSLLTKKYDYLNYMIP